MNTFEIGMPDVGSDERLSKGENTESARVLRDYELDLPSGGVRLAAHLVGTHFHDAILV